MKLLFWKNGITMSKQTIQDYGRIGMKVGGVRLREKNDERPDNETPPLDSQKALYKIDFFSLHIPKIADRSKEIRIPFSSRK